ncbi:MAG: EFR1 family ferrodoxin [Lachnospiraceae bacterium]|nr:EFR1 family ferrodoxin [Lachnospiraceae bacterium]
MKKIHAVFISPTGNTSDVACRIGKSIASRTGAVFEAFDFTLPAARNDAFEFTDRELVVFGVPVYAGRIPEEFIQFIQKLFKGNGTPVIPVVTFGNRGYDSALAELSDILEDLGFCTIAAAAVCCSHAYAGIGKGRPNKNDVNEIKDFAAKIASLILDENAAFPEKPYPPAGFEIQPASIPLKEDGSPAEFSKAKPETDSYKCSHCAICADLCPMGSISYDEPSRITGVCIKCQACVKYCPQGAKRFTDRSFLSHKAALERDYSKPAKNEFFI